MKPPKRSSVAGRMPPIIMSVTSVVVRSSAAERKPLSASFSMERPPVPVEWKALVAILQPGGDLLHGRGW